MWQTLGARTIDVMADGCFCLAQLWDSAWKEGGGDTAITRFDAIDEATLEGLYQNPDFLHSYTIDQIEPILEGGGEQAEAEAPPARKRRGVRRPKA